ncbi:hypothetical protein [Mariniblastus fucicola]|uniref:PhoD-like phosphatase n=1 Tax=Mariniblastus fucicola TaxID=980251 RepID=A0A5B9PIY5_9BACT|nr:hypothetical protein [Mariniblastus fucicola]QEG25245.1 hypothetical protein MFFC18_51690 [Mariniblastus fucicola]
MQPEKNKTGVDRREMMAASVAMAAAGPSLLQGLAKATLPVATKLSAKGNPNSLYHGHAWQTLNPGFWKVENGALRRRIKNYGDRARKTGFPFHAVTHGFKYETEYDPSLPPCAIYARQWKLKDKFSISATITFQGDRPEPEEGDDPAWKMYTDGFGQFGLALGAKSIYESYTKLINTIRFVWSDDRKLRLVFSGNKQKGLSKSIDTKDVAVGDTCEFKIDVEPVAATENTESTSKIVATMTVGSEAYTIEQTVPSKMAAGYVGVTSQGILDFSVDEFNVDPLANKPLEIGVADCLSCYPLGDSLAQNEAGDWTVKFIGLFASDGDTAELRIADSQDPEGGWQSVPVAGSAKIVTNKWRSNTSVILASLPANPAEKTMYYTVWKDGVNVTADSRVGTDACGPGSGLVGDVPGGGNYVGRLPQLKAPYKMCGLSCHAINEGLQQRVDGQWKMTGRRDDWIIRDQPTVESYKHLDDYDFQVMLWEDDVWYMELVMYPPSTDDAYNIVAHSICGPTSRWQMMRHWNVINPGDHDYGMDDVKGPEQIAIRNVEGLGQDRDYMRRNFQIVHHLTTGAEEVDPTINPKKWRAWKMPDRDFTLIVCDSRLWRSSQDVDIWDDAGWGKFKSLYDRTDPTRSLLGEEQFAWLQEQLATDSSPLICLTGISGLHTIWTGAKYGKTSPSMNHPMKFSQRDRVTADYAGWVKAGADRVLELLGSRQGIATVYGDVHNGCIMTNQEHRVVECSFGPIGRSGGRGVIPGFGPKMKDVDDRDLEIHSLYHAKYSTPSLDPHEKGTPYYWNFLEAEFDTTKAEPTIGMRIRNLVDPPNQTPRGGGDLEVTVSQTGQSQLSTIAAFKTLPNADVRFSDVSGKPIQGTRSSADGSVRAQAMIDVPAGTTVIATAFDGKKVSSQTKTTT